MIFDDFYSSIIFLEYLKALLNGAFSFIYSKWFT